MATAKPQSMTHSVKSTTVADLLERILDKGIVVTGDIKIKLVDVELLTVELRLVICSVDKAVEMGMDWWNNNPAFAPQAAPQEGELSSIEKRLEKIEKALVQ